MLEIKEQVLHRVRLHLKVPGWSSDLKAPLTKKLHYKPGNIETACKTNVKIISKIALSAHETGR